MFKLFSRKFIPYRPHPKHFDRIRIEHGEILSQDDCEGILFFMRPKLDWGGGLNSAVLQVAGPGLDDYVLNHILSPKSGDVYKLPAFGTRYKALFVAILADWDGGVDFNERDLLDCYRHALEQARAAGVHRLAIPAMGRDKRDFPHVRFARLALQGILEKMDAGMEFVKIVCIDHTMMRTYQEQIDKMKRRIS